MQVAIVLVATVWVGLLSLAQLATRRMSGVVLVPAIAAISLAWIALVWHEEVVASRSNDIPSLGVWEERNIVVGATLFAIAAVGFSIGTAIGVFTRAPRQTSIDEDVASANAMVDYVQRHARLLVVVGLIALVSYVVVYGPSLLISRDQYNAQYAIPSLSTIFFVFAPTFGIVFGLLFWTAKTGRARVWYGVLVALGFLVVLGTASRTLILYVAVIYFTAIIARKARWWVHMLALITAGTMLVIPVRLRALPDHGLIPYLSEIAGNPAMLLPGDPFAALANVVFSVPLAGYVSSLSRFSFNELWIVASPLDGESAGWRELAARLRVGDYIPFNGFGELAAISPLLLAAVCVAVGIFFARLFTVPGLSPTIRAAVAAFYLLFFALMAQYDLRSAARVLYLAIAGAICVAVLRVGRKKSAVPRRTRLESSTDEEAIS